MATIVIGGSGGGADGSGRAGQNTGQGQQEIAMRRAGVSAVFIRDIESGSSHILQLWDLSAITGTFLKGEIVTQASGSVGIVHDTATGVGPVPVRIAHISGVAFAAGALTGAESGATGTLAANVGYPTPVVASGMATVLSGTVAGAIGEVRSRTVAHFRAGMESYARFAFAVPATPVAGIKLTVGAIDDENGFAVQWDGPNIQFVSRRATVDTLVPRASWYDPLNGTGPSGLVIDWTMMNIFVGRVMFPSSALWLDWQAPDGTWVPVLKLSANAASVPATDETHIYLSARAENTTGVAQAQINVGYWESGNIGDGDADDPLHRKIPSSGTAILPIAPMAGPLPIFSFRLARLYDARPTKIGWDIIVARYGAANDDVTFQVWKNATLAGAVWAALSAHSAIETDTTATSMAGGELLESFQIKKDQSELDDFVSAFQNIVRGEWITVAAILTDNVGGGPADASASILLQENF